MQATQLSKELKHDHPCWSMVQRFMLRTCGVVLHEDQSYLVDSRLASVAKHHGFQRIDEFVHAACTGPATSACATALIDAMTTHETLFFRDPPFWNNLEKIVLPPLVEKARSGARIRIWSAACSTGQEPYSVAMLIGEKFPELESAEIIASDVAELSVERARQGTFTVLEANRGLSAPRLIRNFEQVPCGFRVRPKLRERITWSVHNLLGSKPDPGDCDLVLCRNVLIYFGETDRAEVTRRLFGATGARGVVAVGSTETLREKSIAAGFYVRRS